MANDVQKCAHYGCQCKFKEAKPEVAYLPRWVGMKGEVSKRGEKVHTLDGFVIMMVGDERSQWKMKWLRASGWEESSLCKAEHTRKYSWTCLRHHRPGEWVVDSAGSFKLCAWVEPNPVVVSRGVTPIIAGPGSSHPVVRSAEQSLKRKFEGKRVMGSPEKRLAAVLGLMNQQSAVIADNCAHSNELAIQVKTLQVELKLKSNTKMPPFVSPPDEVKSPLPSCILRPTAALKGPETYTYTTPMADNMVRDKTYQCNNFSSF